jgi:anaerobic ribonucleoside-triphosphate reductase
MPKIIDVLYVSVTDELMEKPLMCLEYEIKKLLKTGFNVKGNVIIKIYSNGITKYSQHLVKYDSK